MYLHPSHSSDLFHWYFGVVTSRTGEEIPPDTLQAPILHSTLSVHFSTLLMPRILTLMSVVDVVTKGYLCFLMWVFNLGFGG